MIHDDKVDGISGLGPINISSLNQQVPTSSSAPAHSLKRSHKYDLLDCSTGAPFLSPLSGTRIIFYSYAYLRSLIGWGW